MRAYSTAEARLAGWLDRVALGAAVLGLATLLVAWADPGLLRLPVPGAAGTIAGLALLAIIARVASGDVPRFRAATWLVVAGLALLGATLILLAVAGGGGALPALLVGGGLAVALAVAVGVAAASSPAGSSWRPWLTDKAPTAWEVAATIACATVGVAALVGIANLVIAAFSAPPWLGGSPVSRLAYGGMAFYWALAGLTLLVAARHVRRDGYLLALANVSLVIAILAQLATSATLNPTATVFLPLLGAPLPGAMIWRDVLLGELVVALLVLALENRMSYALFDDLAYFAPLDFHAFEAFTEALFELGASARVPAHQVVLRADSYLGSFRSSRATLARWCVRLWEFLPLLWLRPPLTFLAPARRRAFLYGNFVRDGGESRPLYQLLDRLGLDVVIAGFDTALRFAMQLAYMGYYGDPDIQRELGYVPFSQRPKDFPVVAVRPYQPLRVETPEDLRIRGVDVLSSADVVVIGSGAAGALLAERLAEQGRDVLVLDKGPYVPPDTFTEDEIDMLSRLYGDGGLQMAESFAFNIVQGSCIGGSTTVNNAVCFETPDRVLDRWNEPGETDARIDRDRYRAVEAAVKARMTVRSIKDSSVTRRWPDVLNQGDHVVEDGVTKLLAGVAHEYDVVRANIADCLGCGYCNLGCKYGRKLSMLDEVLPRAQQRYGDHFRIFSETEVLALGTRGGKVTEIVARVGGRRPLTIRNPNTVIVSAGAIASSWLLAQSGIGGGELPVGRRLGGNVATPLHGLFDETLDSFHGLQIAHYLELPDNPGYVFESEFNPPISQALLMPGWLDTHERNMRHYRQLTMFGLLVGSDPVAYVDRPSLLGGGPNVAYKPTRRDLEQIVEGLTLLGKVMFAGGAKEVLPSTRSYRSYDRPIARYRCKEDLVHLADLILADPANPDIILATAHPQGGNALGARRGPDGGVVDPESFRVYGYDNLYVCDASIIPSPTTVNPQLTVMTLAYYAADLIA